MDESGDLSELCDLCGVVIAAEAAVYALVPDSSFVHASDPKLDGQRLVTACSAEHLATLKRKHQQRRWMDVEQWAGKVARGAQPGGRRAGEGPAEAC